MYIKGLRQIQLPWFCIIYNRSLSEDKENDKCKILQKLKNQHRIQLFHYYKNLQLSK